MKEPFYRVDPETGIPYYNEGNNKPVMWNKLPKNKIPDWLPSFLESLGAGVVTDSDSIMWRFDGIKTHLQIDVDKILMYANNVLQYRTYYYEGKV